MTTVHLYAPTTSPEWTEDGQLRLWSADLVVVWGATADIRALLARALDLIPPRKGERE